MPVTLIHAEPLCQPENHPGAHPIAWRRPTPTRNRSQGSTLADPFRLRRSRAMMGAPRPTGSSQQPHGRLRWYRDVICYENTDTRWSRSYIFHYDERFILRCEQQADAGRSAQFNEGERSRRGGEGLSLERRPCTPDDNDCTRALTCHPLTHVDRRASEGWAVASRGRRR